MAFWSVVNHGYIIFLNRLARGAKQITNRNTAEEIRQKEIEMEKREIFLKAFFLIAGTLLVISGILMILGFCCAVAYAQEQNAPEKPVEIDVKLKDGHWKFEVGNVEFTFTKPTTIVAKNGQDQQVYVKVFRKNDDKTRRLLKKFHLSSANSKMQEKNLLGPVQEEALSPSMFKDGTFQNKDVIWIEVETTSQKLGEIGGSWVRGLSKAVSGKEQKDEKVPLLGNTMITLKE